MASQKQPKAEDGSVLGFLRETLIVVVAALIVSTLLRLFLIQVFVIPSASMENTLLIKDRVAVQKVSPINRGDIVVFADDNGWLGTDVPERTPTETALQFVGILPDSSQNYLIKRAIGLPGDHVKCCDPLGRVTVNGVALDESDYLYRSSSGKLVKPSDEPFDVVVPQDRIFVLGDHRNDSADSRCHLAESYNGVLGSTAFIKRESIVGSGVATVFPFNRWSGHGVPDTFKNVPAPTTSAPAAPVVTGDPPHC